MNEQTKKQDITSHHIGTTALNLYLTQEIKKVTMDDIAQAAGVTRVTVYRHYPNKKDLVQAVFMIIAAGFERAQQQVKENTNVTIEAMIDIITNTIASLPPCDFPSRLDELGRIYPAIYQQFHDIRLAALEVIFDRLFTLAETQGRLRPSLNRQVVRIYFMEAVVNVVESPRLVALGLSPNDVFQTVKSIFLYGILRDA